MLRPFNAIVYFTLTFPIASWCISTCLGLCLENKVEGLPKLTWSTGSRPLRECRVRCGQPSMLWKQGLAGVWWKGSSSPGAQTSQGNGEMAGLGQGGGSEFGLASACCLAQESPVNDQFPLSHPSSQVPGPASDCHQYQGWNKENWSWKEPQGPSKQGLYPFVSQRSIQWS